MLAAAVVTAGVARFAVLVVMLVTVNIGIVAQTSAEQCAHRCISVPADTAIELDTRLGQSCLRTAADASADQSVYAVLHQEACQCAVTAAVGVNDFLTDDFAVRSFIKLELFGVAEMLKNLTVFIGNCNFHNGISLAFFVGFFCVGSLHPAATAAVGCLLSSADAVVSPCDVQRFPVDKARCDLAPCDFVNLLHGRAGNIHLHGTLLVGLLLQVNQPNDLVLVQRQQDRLDILAPVGAEFIDLRCVTNPTAPWRSWHGHASFVSGIYRLYGAFRELSIRSERFTALEFEGHPSVSVDTEKLKTVTPNSVIHYHAVIYQALKYAMKTDMVPQNVAMKVDRPRKNSFQPTFLDAEQMQKLFEVVKGTRLELPVLVAAFYWADHDQQIPGALCGGH